MRLKPEKERCAYVRSFFSYVHLDRLGRGHRSFRDPDYLEICVPEDRFVIFGAAQRQAESQHRAIVARADRLTRLAKYAVSPQ